LLPRADESARNISSIARSLKCNIMLMNFKMFLPLMPSFFSLSLSLYIDFIKEIDFLISVKKLLLHRNVCYAHNIASIALLMRASSTDAAASAAEHKALCLACSLAFMFSCVSSQAQL
jgi:hypothetical protein